MAKKKYYAVRKGNNIGVFENWADCQQSILGYSNAEYKSFGSKEDAENYINYCDIGEKHVKDAINSDIVIAYVDGSYSDEVKRYSFGCVLIQPDGQIIKKSGYGDDPNALIVRNIAGELQGTMFAVKYAYDNKFKRITIRHDYVGVSKWYTGEWKAKDQIAKKYIEFMANYKTKIQISFEKVQAHSGDKFNEEADQLAKSAIENGEKVKKGSYGLVATGIKIEDLEAIIEILKEDFKGTICEESNEAYCRVYTVTNLEGESLKIKHYSEYDKIYIQGKPSKVFSLMSTYVTELVDVNQIPEIFNEYYKIDIKKQSIEEQYKILLPKASNNLPEKIQKVLHQAVYNLNLHGEMYDPTCLTYPSYRALEGFLKFILNKVNICYDSGFNMFKSNGSKTHKLLSEYEKNIGSPKKISYYNKCYNYFYNNRHTLFHWDDPCASTDTTRIIGTVDYAHKYIKDTLELIEEYFNIL